MLSSSSSSSSSNTAVAEATSMDFIMPCYKQLECYKYCITNIKIIINQTNFEYIKNEILILI